MRFPPCSTSMRVPFAPASSAFSSSSFTTDAGRSTTSPAAILFATDSGSMRMRDINSSRSHPFWVLAPTSRTRISFGGFFDFGLDREAQLVKLLRVHIARRVGHQVLRGGCFGEGHDFANGFFAGEQHGDAVHAQRDAAMRWRAIRQRVEKKAEAAAKLLLAQAERLEQPLLNVLPMNPDAAGA